MAKGIKVWDPLEPCLGAITMLVHEAQLRGGERRGMSGSSCMTTDRLAAPGARLRWRQHQ